jgi:antitoxin (DNA-binding transcriptional repressor) of toxin-antitoxin stability system
VGVPEAKNRPSQRTSSARAGSGVVIAEGGEPTAALVPAADAPSTATRQVAFGRGRAGQSGFMGLMPGNAKAAGLEVARGSRFMGLIRGKSNTAFGRGAVAGSGCMGLMPGNAKAAGLGFAHRSRFMGLIRGNVIRVSAGG